MYIRILIATLLALLVVGCSSQQAYLGSHRANDEIAVIRGFGVSLRKVNDIEIGSNSSAVDVLPGKNRVVVTADASNYNMLGSEGTFLVLEVNAEAGKQYAITSQRGIGRLCAYEIESSTGQPDYHRSAGCLKPPSQESRQ